MMPSAQGGIWRPLTMQVSYRSCAARLIGRRGWRSVPPIDRVEHEALENVSTRRPDGSGLRTAASYPYSWSPMGVSRVLSRHQEG